MQRELILGGPGCGKTTRLLEIVERHLQDGIQPNQIAYVAFTRKAANEALSRASQQFGVQEKELPFFRTLHSLAFKELSLDRDQLMSESHYNELGDHLKVKFGNVDDEFGVMAEQRERGSQYYYIEQQARLRCIPLRQMALLDGRQSHWHVQHFQDALKNFKASRDILDYTDILEKWHDDMPALPIKVLIVDEAQDLSPLQWKLIHKLEQGVPYVYYAGDDDQAIYTWAGADVNHFLSLDVPRTVLPISHRLPKEVFTRCTRISRRIRNRYAKDWQPCDRQGVVSVVASPELAPLGSGEWMLLARNHYHLESTASYLRAKGFVYQFGGRSSLSSADALAVRAWLRSQLCELVSIADAKRIAGKISKGILKCEPTSLYAMNDDQTIPREVLLDVYGIDLNLNWEQVLVLKPLEKAYIKLALMREPDLDAPPRIKISTIHAVKGGECDNVLLLPDMSSACYESFIKKPDDEARVFYVGASRAKQRLVICQPQSGSYFPL